MEIVFAGFAAVLLAIVCVLLRNQKKSDGTQEADELKKQLAGQTDKFLREHERVVRLEEQLKNAQSENFSLSRERDGRLAAEKELSTAKAELAAEKDKLKEFDANRKKAAADMETAFENLSRKILQERSEEFRKTSKAEFLSPLKEELENLRKRISENSKNASETTAELRGKIDEITNKSENLGKEAKNLASALRGNIKMQGNWGEMILARALESAGLKKDLNFTLQETVKVEDQNHGFTDALLKFPDGRVLVIDSKVSLNAYVDYCSAQDASSRERAQKEHLKSVKKHIDELGDKYKSVKGSAEFALMFIPNDGAYLLANEADSALWEYAQKKNVVIVSTAHLLGVLRLLEQCWRQDAQIKNIEGIMNDAKKLMDKFSGALKSFDDIGDKLEKAKESYRKARGQFLEGKGNALAIAGGMIEKGVKSKDEFKKIVEAETENSNAAIELGSVDNEA